jgi:hypothetical protein
MTLDPKALNAAAHALTDPPPLPEGVTPRYFTSWRVARLEAERTVCAYLAALDRDPLVDAAREALHWIEDVIEQEYSGNPAHFPVVGKLRAALGEGDGS